MVHGAPSIVISSLKRCTYLFLKKPWHSRVNTAFAVTRHGCECKPIVAECFGPDTFMYGFSIAH